MVSRIHSGLAAANSSKSTLVTFRRRTAVAAAAVLVGSILSCCEVTPTSSLSPADARDGLVKTIEDSAAKLDARRWSRDHAPEVGDCDGQQGERANYTYGYGAPAPDGDRGADAKIIADYWTSLGMQVRVVDTPMYVVYASGGPVEGLSFSTAPGDYYIAGTSLCVPGDAAELRNVDNG